MSDFYVWEVSTDQAIRFVSTDAYSACKRLAKLLPKTKLVGSYLEFYALNCTTGNITKEEIEL